MILQFTHLTFVTSIAWQHSKIFEGGFLKSEELVTEGSKPILSNKTLEKDLVGQSATSASPGETYSFYSCPCVFRHLTLALAM